MRTPEPAVRDELWTRESKSFASIYFALDRLLAARKSPERDKSIVEMFESSLGIAYKAGLDRGYDMAASIYDPDNA